MKINVGINGLGRIGRMTIRSIIENNYKLQLLSIKKNKFSNIITLPFEK